MSTSPDRVPGFYWVDGGDEPEPARWDGERWALIGTDKGQDDADVFVVSETPIVLGAPAGQRQPVGHAAS